MLYSQYKERGRRFFTAIKVAIPFFLISSYLAYNFYQLDTFDNDDFVLFTFLALIYVYYTFFMLFENSELNYLDSVTKVFNRVTIQKILNKNVGKNKIMIMFGLKNIDQIISRYGLESINGVLYNFILIVNDVLENNKLHNIPIGEYISGFFIMLVDQRSDLDTIMKKIEIRINKFGIDNIETRFIYSSVLLGRNVNYCISSLSYELFSVDKKLNLSFYESEIRKSLNKANFLFKTQTIKSINNQENMVYITQKLNLQNDKIQKVDFIQIINKLGLEVDYDITLLKTLFNKNFDIKSKMFLEISPVSIRNSYFQRELLRLIKDKKIDSSKIVIEFHESEFYEDMKLFSYIAKMYRKFGFSLAISHFGGKNSSFEYLKYLEIDYVIYDLEFSKNILQDKTKIIFQNTLNLVHELGIKAILRFVDKKEIYDMAQELKVDYLQGFYIQKPIKLEF